MKITAKKIPAFVPAALIAATLLFCGCSQSVSGSAADRVTWKLDTGGPDYEPANWFRAASGWETEYVNGVATGQTREAAETADPAHQALGAPWRFDAETGEAGSAWAAVPGGLSGVNGIGYRKSGGQYLFLASDPLKISSGKVLNPAPKAAYRLLDEQLAGRATNANKSFGDENFFKVSVDQSGYNTVADMYDVRIASKFGCIGADDFFCYQSFANQPFVLDFTFVIIKGDAGWAIPYRSGIFSAGTTVTTTVSKFIAETALQGAIDGSNCKTIFKTLVDDGYKLFFVINAAVPATADFNSSSCYSYRNVIQL